MADKLSDTDIFCRFLITISKYTVNNFQKDIFRKEFLTYKQNFKRSVLSYFCSTGA